MAKKVKVNDLVKKHGFSLKEIMHELRELGVDCKTGKTTVPDDILGIVEEHLAALKDAAIKKATTAAASKKMNEIHLKSPIVVKNVAEALDKKANEIVSALMSMNILANINQKIDADVAIKLGEKFGVDIVVDKRDKADHVVEAEEEVAPEDVEYYLCGPPVMNSAVIDMLTNLGVEPENIMLDDFGE